MGISLSHNECMVVCFHVGATGIVSDVSRYMPFWNAAFQSNKALHSMCCKVLAAAGWLPCLHHKNSDGIRNATS
jgi:hypothetical protein